MASEERKKGTFSDLKLTVSKRYIYPFSRKRMISLGGLAVLALGGYYLFNSLLQNNSFDSSGPLSSSHVNLDNDCSACHVKFGSVSSEKCSTCHEVPGSPGRIYSFAAHYIYKTNDVERIKQAKSRHESDEMPCRSCHPEHEGRTAAITRVDDDKCNTCHGFGSLNKNHPEFAFVAQPPSDEANLEFPHRVHVDAIKFNEGIADDKLESTCTMCHRFQSDGSRFLPIDYQQDCRECHGPHRRDEPGALANPNLKCRTCHVISGASVAKVQLDQRVFSRAEFDHGPHTLLANCLDCHNRIDATGQMPDAKSPDEAATLNLPGISNCRSCHAPDKASNLCASCHEFHPAKNLRFTLSTAN